MPVLHGEKDEEKEYCKNPQARVDCWQTQKKSGRIIHWDVAY
jgi:hypothetical protein